MVKAAARRQGQASSQQNKECYPHPKIKADHGINNKHPASLHDVTLDSVFDDNDSRWAWPMRSTVGILSFYPWLAGSQSLKSVFGVSQNLPHVCRWLLEPYWCRWERAAAASTHTGMIVTMLPDSRCSEITWQQGIPGSPARGVGLEEPAVANISPFPACVSAQLLGCEVSVLLGYQEMQKSPWTLRHPMSGRKVNTAGPVGFIVWFVFTFSLKSKFWVNEQR